MQRRPIQPASSSDSQRSSDPGASASDLETTAELPVLDVAAYEATQSQGDLSSTDTWVVPAREFPAARADDRAPQPPAPLEENLRALSASLREVEHQLARKAEQLTLIEGELEAARDARLAAERRADAASSELTDARLALSTAQAQIAELTQRLATRDAQTRLVGEHDRALARARQQLEEAHLRIAAHHEALQSREGRRGVFETMLRDLDGEVDRRDTQLVEARAQHASALTAAEARIRRLESELLGKTARVEELARLSGEWRATLEAARESLEERDALIRRLEAEAAHSAALLDTINLQPGERLLDSLPDGESEPGPAARLLIRTEGDGEVVHVLGRKTSIGRTPDNDVQIDTKFVSRHHAVILTGPAHAIIEDLNSTNGVLVNGRRATRQTLQDADVITVGKTQFRFAVRQPAARRAP